MDTKEQILQTARELFLERGFRKTTTREIAEQADVNLGLIPYYFKKKEELARQVYQDILDEIIDAEIIRDIKGDDSIGRFMMFYTLVHHRMLMLPGVFDFYLELIYEDIVAVEAQPYTYQLVKSVVEEFDLQADEQEVHLSVLMMKGAERALTKHKLEKKIGISFLEMNELLVKDLLLLLGIPKGSVEQSIRHARSDLDRMELDQTIYS